MRRSLGRDWLVLMPDIGGLCREKSKWDHTETDYCDKRDGPAIRVVSRDGLERIRGVQKWNGDVPARGPRLEAWTG